MSSAALIPVDLTQLPSVQLGNDEAFDNWGKSNSRLDSLRFYSKADGTLRLTGHPS